MFMCVLILITDSIICINSHLSGTICLELLFGGESHEAVKRTKLFFPVCLKSYFHTSNLSIKELCRILGCGCDWHNDGNDIVCNLQLSILRRGTFLVQVHIFLVNSLSLFLSLLLTGIQDIVSQIDLVWFFFLCANKGLATFLYKLSPSQRQAKHWWPPSSHGILSPSYRPWCNDTILKCCLTFLLY